MRLAKLLSLYIVILLIINSCTNNTDEKQEIRKFSNTEESRIDKYRRNALKEDSVFNLRIDRLLKHLNEPDLRTSKIETFRFILHEYPKSEHVLFRIEKDSNNKVTFITKYYVRKDEMTGEGEDSVTKEIVKVLTLADWEKIRIKSLESYFWSLEMRDSYEPGPCRGAFWTIEGKRQSHYGYESFKEYARVYRVIPYKGSFFELGLAIAQLHDKSMEKILVKYFKEYRMYSK